MRFLRGFRAGCGRRFLSCGKTAGGSPTGERGARMERPTPEGAESRRKRGDHHRFGGAHRERSTIDSRTSSHPSGCCRATRTTHEQRSRRATAYQDPREGFEWRHSRWRRHSGEGSRDVTPGKWVAKVPPRPRSPRSVCLRAVRWRKRGERVARVSARWAVTRGCRRWEWFPPGVPPGGSSRTRWAIRGSRWGDLGARR